MKKLFAVFITIMALSCAKDSNNLKTIIKNKSNALFLKHEILNLNGVLYNPGGLIMLGDSLLLVHDPAEGFHLAAINLNNLKIRRYIRKGKGPHEVLMMGSLAKNSHNGIAYNDIRTSKFYNAHFENDSLVVDREVNLSMTDGKPYYTVQSPDSLFVATGTFPGGKYSVFSKNGNLQGTYIEYPDNLKVNNIFKGIAYQGKLCFKSDGKKVLFVARNCGLLDILEFKNSDLELYKRICYYTPKYTVSSTQKLVSIDNENIAGFPDAYVSDSKIYVMYSGKTYAEKKELVNYSNIILVYNWKGKFLYKMELDREIFTFTIDNSEKTLYAITQYPDVQLLKFPIQ